ncbi:MAG: cytochrome C biogenesis protein CcsB, partial [Deltaproteobacteria bacterium]|nr:cytochrome C biogenesis protein CcsB [Deltaproteobacteria bacterium]
MQQVTYWVAIGAGLASFLTPCVLPMVPIYLASLCGADVFSADPSRKRLPVLLHTVSFIFGFSFVFIALGLAAGMVGLVFG